MSRVAIQDTITSPATGIAVPSATVTVRDGDSLGDLSTIYLQREGGDTANNPISVGDPGFTNDGELAVYADPGLYWVEVDTGGVTRSYELDLVAVSDIRQRVIYVATISDLQSLDTAPLPDGQQVSVTDQDTGGVYRYDESATSGGIAPDAGDGRWLLVRANAQAITFNNVQQMKDFAPLYEGAKARTLGYYDPGDGGGCDYEIVAAGTGSNYGFLFEQLSGSGLEAKLLGGGVMEDKTAFISSDYGTLQEAVDDLSKLRVSQNATIDLMIESGHQLSSGAFVSNGDYSHFSISSTDPEAALSESFTGIVVRASYASAPTLNCVINAGKLDSGGYWVDSNSKGRISPGCGVINSGGRAIYSAHGSTVHANGCVISGSSSNAMWCTTGSTINAEGAEAHDCEGIVFYCSRNSRINASNSRALNCTGDYIAWCKRPGTLNIHDSELSGGTTWAIWADFGGVISCHNTDIADNPERCFQATNGGVIQASSKTFGASPATVGSGVFAQAVSAGRISLSGYTVDGYSGGLLVTDNGNISANGITIMNSSGNGVFCQDVGTISLRTATVKFSGSNDLAISHGGFIAARQCETTNGDGRVALEDTNASALDALTRDGVIFAGG